MLTLETVNACYGRVRALKDVSLEVAAGEIVAVIGPNGAGKTTTMRVCATLQLPDGGDGFVDGHSVLDDPREVSRRLGLMPDS